LTEITESIPQQKYMISRYLHSSQSLGISTFCE